MTFQQNQFPYDLSVAAPGGEPVLFADEFRVGNGPNYAAVPGSSPPLLGLQMPPAGYNVWLPGAEVYPPGGFAYIDCLRHALGVFAVRPILPKLNSWVGLTRRVGSWSLEDDTFRLRLFTRVGALPTAGTVGLIENTYAGAIVSLATLEGAADGAFVTLGLKLTATGWSAQFSKWSDHETLVSEYLQPIGATEIALRCIIQVDAEDGLVLRAQYSGGLGWSYFGDDHLLEGENTDIGIGFGATGETGAIGGNSDGGGVCEFLRLNGPYAESSEDTLDLSFAAGSGGRNW